jgi:hypothetical protein
MTPKATYSYDTCFGHVTVTEFHVPRDVIDPIRDAIDKGGGYSVDIEGVIRELAAAGYVIVPKVPTDAMVNSAHHACMDGPKYVWRAMIEAAPKS